MVFESQNRPKHVLARFDRMAGPQEPPHHRRCVPNSPRGTGPGADSDETASRGRVALGATSASSSRGVAGARARARGVEPRERLGVHGVHGVGVKDQTQSVQAIGPDMFLNGDVLGKVLEIDGSLRLQAVAGVLSTRMLG